LSTIPVKKVSSHRKGTQPKGFSRNPFFYFGVTCFIMFGLLFFYSDGLAQPNQTGNTAFFNDFFKNSSAQAATDPFFNPNQELALEPPDLEFIQNSSLVARTTPSTITTAKTLGDVFGASGQVRNEVTNYAVQPGDTVTSLAEKFGISADTVAWANDISKTTSLKPGQNLVILPVSGVLHVVKNGDTISQIAKTYQAKADDIIAINSLANEGDIFIGDILIVPNGIMPRSAPTPASVPLANNYFIYPLLKFRITQGLHYFNAIDIQSLAGCGAPVYAAAGGVVQRAVGNGGYNAGMGNYVTILHPNGVVTYYGHLMKVLLTPGTQVYQGQEIGLEGETGEATGCHVHFQVMGAKNFLAGISVGTIINVTSK
jgi:murein DD-endopeptidase MepM/ murein hydrolase activator NlpD